MSSRPSPTPSARTADAVAAWAEAHAVDVDTVLYAVAHAVAALDGAAVIDRPPATEVERTGAHTAGRPTPAHVAGPVELPVAVRASLDAMRAAHLADPGRHPHPAHLLGAVYERLLHPGARRARGAHFTPPDVAARLVAFALDGAAPVRRVCDPACGGGVFLLACAEHLALGGRSRLDAARAMHGVDIDPRAVWVSATALELWAPGCAAASRVVHADALHDALPWHDLDAVIGNPPFQNQLQIATARTATARARVAARTGRPSAYVDAAALFLLHGLDLVRAGGRVALVQPQSTLVARDATAVRAELADRADLVGLWFAPDAIFAANVQVCAPVLERRREPDALAVAEPARPAVRRALGRAFAPAGAVPAPRSPESWAPLASDLLGVPRVQLRGTARVGDLATATAGFRDEYYGLVGAVRDAPPDVAVPDDVARLVTCGLIDVLGCRWGERVVRFARVRYDAPVVDLDALDGRVGAWVRAQLVPKVLVATQSKVVEVVVDEHGSLVPSTPVIAVHAPADQLWRLAAALSAPCISAHAFAMVAGAALSAGAIKLAARQVLDLPLPLDDGAWAHGAVLAAQAQHSAGAARVAALDELGRTMDAAYGVTDPAVGQWWRDRRGGR